MAMLQLQLQPPRLLVRLAQVETTKLLKPALTRASLLHQHLHLRMQNLGVVPAVGMHCLGC
jgi:hypothetical protein